MTTELFAQSIRKEHFRAELQRLNEGWPGCGCADCQELYKTLDHSKYGTRVTYLDGIVIIGEDPKLHRDGTGVTATPASTDRVKGVTAPSGPTPLSDGAKTGLDASIAKLSADGLSSRQIAEQLGLMGIDVSHMTVTRKLRRAAGR